MKKFFGAMTAVLAAFALMSCSTGGDSHSYEVPVVTIVQPETTTYQVGSSVVLKATSSIKNVDFTWYDYNLNALDGSNYVESLKTSACPITLPATAGSYTYTAVAQNRETDDDHYSGNATITFTVTAGPVTAELVSINCSDVTVELNASVDFVVNAIIREGVSQSTVDVTDEAVITIADPSIASYSNGSITGLAVGSTTLTASYTLGSVTKIDTCTITVNPEGLTLTGITVVPATTSIAAGSTTNLVVTATFSDGSTSTVTSSAHYQSNSTAVATVSSGVVTGVAAGSSTITVSYTYNGVTKTDTCTVTVTAPVIYLVSISAVLGSTSLDVNSSTTLVITATYSDGSSKTVTQTAVEYSVDGIVELSSQTVTAKAAGTTTITVSYTEAGITKTDTTPSITVSASGEGDGKIGFSFL